MIWAKIMNEELKMIQDEINRCVYETFNGVSGYDGFSIPCIPRISSQYLKNRFVILAQETNTWYPNVGHFQDLASSKYCNLEKILYENCYDDFCQWASETYKGAFWDFSRFLYSDEGVLCGPIHQDKYLTHCWMNLFCIEKCRNKRDRFGRPSQNRNLAEFIVKIQKDLVFKILKIIKPKTILAMTGYQNDSFLIENGLGTSFDRVEFYPIDKENIYSRNHIAEIKINDENNPLSKTKIIRSYHPNFFTKRINRKNIFKEIGQKIMERFGKTKSQYYREILLDSLKSE